jgi:hypothetical protein
MRRFVACLVAALLSTVAVDGSAAHSAHAASSISAGSSISTVSSISAALPDRAVVDRLVFEVPLTRFRVERSRAKRTHRWLVTSTDGCSAPLVGSTGKSFDFRLACERHDLAYANYPALARVDSAVAWDAALRARVDDQFQRDLQGSCLRRRHSERLRCDAWVVVFFHAVRLAAGP